MKKLSLIAMLLVLPFHVWAAPTDVTLFPSSALIEEISPVTTRPVDGGFLAVTLSLPGQADPATLRVGRLPEKSALVDVSWKSRAEGNQAALKPLTARLEELTSQRNTLAAETEGVQGELAFWKARFPVSQQSVAQIRELASTIGSSVHAQTSALQRLSAQLTDVDAEITRVKTEIAAAAGQRTVWEVTILLTGHAPDRLEYSYTLSDCGWEPVYRLEALPAREVIDFTWQARVWQRSGQDWQNVRMHLATMQPDVQTEPGELSPWEIRPVGVVRKTMAADTMMAMRAGGAMAEVEAAPAMTPPMPVQQRYSTYAAWDMGMRSLPAGPPRMLEIERATWKTEFTHLLRPALSPKAFIQGTATFDEPRELPDGKAFVLIDGATVEQRQFALSGREATLFFGADPLLTCETTLKDKKTGDKGLFKTRQTFVRSWTLTVHNAGQTDARYRLEEPGPVIRDERIKLDVTTTPAPLKTADEDILAWEGTLKGGTDQTITVNVQFEAPDDMPVDPGWRW